MITEFLSHDITIFKAGLAYFGSLVGHFGLIVWRKITNFPFYSSAGRTTQPYHGGGVHFINYRQQSSVGDIISYYSIHALYMKSFWNK